MHRTRSAPSDTAAPTDTPTARTEYTCPICREPIAGDDDWMVHPMIDGKVHHLACLEQRQPTAIQLRVVELAMGLFDACSEADEWRAELSLLMNEVYLAGVEEGRQQQELVVHDRPEPNPVDVGDEVEWPTCLPSWSTRRRISKVVAVDKPHAGFVTVVHVEEQDGRKVEAKGVVAIEHVRVVSRAERLPKAGPR